MRAVRKIIAQRMMDSLRDTAQLTYHGDADVTGLMARRRIWKAGGQAIGLEDCLLHALAGTLAVFPDFNGVSDLGSVTRLESIDVSIAISTPAGLMTPVLKGLGALSLSQIAERRRALVDRTLAGDLAVSEMKGGSITLSNLGHTRVRYFTPILNAGQIALLGVGRLTDALVPGPDGQAVPVRLLPLSLTADHRIVDGEPAGRFLTALCERLEALDKDG